MPLANLPPATVEAELLLCCSRVRADDVTVERIKTLCTRTIDWQLFLSAAENHRLMPLVHWNLSRHSDGVPKNVLAELARDFIESSRLSSNLLEELQELIEELEAEGICVVPFKGPVIAEHYYGDTDFRSFSDIDILVPVDQVAAAIRLVKRRGFDPCPWRDDFHFPDQFFQSAHVLVQLSFEYTFYRKPDGTWLDLHWQVLPKHFWKMTSEVLFANTAPRTVHGRQMRCFTDEMTLFLLCGHASKHAWCQLNWITDVAELVAQSSLDWPSLLTRAQMFGVRKMVLVGLNLTRYLPGGDLPDLVVERIEADLEVLQISRQIMERMMDDPLAVQVKELRTWIEHLRLKDTAAEKLRLLIEKATAPTLDEWVSLPQLQRFVPLYRVVRPLRLIANDVPRIFARLVSGGYDKQMNPKS